MKRFKRMAALFLAVWMVLTLFAGCGGDTQADTVLGSGRDVLRILSGSENAEL